MRFFDFLALGLAASFLVVQPPCAHAEEQMAWTLARYASDLPSHTDTVILTYGIPETDAIAFEAICGGPDGPVPRAVFWYDTIDLPEDQDVVLSLAVGGLAEEVPAKVFGKDAEVGVSGLQAVLSFSAPIWQAMRKGGVLTYRIPEAQEQKLHLEGAAGALREFERSCKFTAGSGAAVQTAAGGASTQRSSLASSGSPKLDSVSCAEFGAIKSERSDTTTKITFVNKSDGYRGIVWIDTEGTPVDNTGLNQGERVVVPTFSKHAWMITDGPGNCIEMVLAVDEDSTFEMMAPASALDPEND